MYLGLIHGAIAEASSAAIMVDMINQYGEDSIYGTMAAVMFGPSRLPVRLR